MVSRENKLRTPHGKRRHKKIYVIATEGTVTEQEYFELFKRYNSLHVINDKSASNPAGVLSLLEDELKMSPPIPPFEAWVVIDRNSWKQNEFDLLAAWEGQQANFNYAISNPLFEFWLLLHFEDAKGVTTAKECLRRLKKYLPGYNKRIMPYRGKFSNERIEAAVMRAKQMDTTPENDCPPSARCTTVYRLVAKLLTPDIQQHD